MLRKQVTNGLSTMKTTITNKSAMTKNQQY